MVGNRVQEALGYSLTILLNATVDAEPAVGGRAKP
jgi:hypothetical protein